MPLNGAFSRDDQVRPGVEFRHVLVATDFSLSARKALEYGRELTRKFRGKLYLLHVIPPEIFHFVAPESAGEALARAREYAHREMHELISDAKLEGVEHVGVVADGDIWPTLREFIKSHEIDLVAVGTHGRSSSRKLSLGAVAEEVFRMADCPVLTVAQDSGEAENSDAQLQRLLYTTNFKPHAERAANLAYSLEHEYKAHLTVLHVVEDSGSDADQEHALVREFLVKRMRRGMPETCKNRCEPEFRVRFGDPVHEILHTAGEGHSDLIVLGVRPSDKYAGQMPSAIAYRIVCQAACPVLTLRK